MRHPKRSAFTLIELLVVMALIVVLATITLLIAPDLGNKSRAATGAERLQGGLLIAKQLALRDSAPRGLRLLVDPLTNQATEFEYIEQPENFVPPEGVSYLVVAQADMGTTSNVQLRIFTGDPTLGNINPFVGVGDWLELTGNRSIYRIVAISGPTGSNPFVTDMVVTPRIREAEMADLVLAANYRFVRRPKPLMGEEPVKLPEGVVIDLAPDHPNTPGTTVSPLPPTPIDIVFSPAGPVTPAVAGRYVYWVRDLEGVGEPSLITVYTRTGNVAAHSIDTISADPYRFTREGRESGL